MDACGGHATPYHFHTDMVCAYDASAAGHSTIVGIMLDGIGIYGRNEATGTVPTDLDGCGGHVGLVPPSTTIGPVTASTVYHYHAQTTAPFLLGCYGPAAVAECIAMYTSRDMGSNGGCDGTATVQLGATASITYDLWCPCFPQTSSTTITTATYSTSDSSNAYAYSDSFVPDANSLKPGDMGFSELANDGKGGMVYRLKLGEVGARPYNADPGEYVCEPTILQRDNECLCVGRTSLIHAATHPINATR
jgi:hypothetical protein